VERFSDFADTPQALDGDKLKIETILNKEITIIGYKVAKGKHNTERCLTLQVDTGEGHRVIFSGSEVLISQMEKYGERCPFVATIKKIDKYYTLS